MRPARRHRGNPCVRIFVCDGVTSYMRMAWRDASSFEVERRSNGSACSTRASAATN